jgi:ABC-type nickel/cobalt efflux system permease component RcnA
MLRAVGASLALSVTHVSVALLIGALSLPLVSIALGSVGRAPTLEAISRALLACVGIWMVWRAFRHAQHHKHEGEVFGFFAGLIPCPLTLFVMALATARGVPAAGLVFAVAMMAGVALTLSAVAALSVLLRDQLQHVLESHAAVLNYAQRLLEGLAGMVLIFLALRQIVGN